MKCDPLNIKTAQRIFLGKESKFSPNGKEALQLSKPQNPATRASFAPILGSQVQLQVLAYWSKNLSIHRKGKYNA